MPIRPPYHAESRTVTRYEESVPSKPPDFDENHSVSRGIEKMQKSRRPLPSRYEESHVVLRNIKRIPSPDHKENLSVSIYEEHAPIKLLNFEENHSVCRRPLLLAIRKAT